MWVLCCLAVSIGVTARDRTSVLLVLGDSLSAGYGLAPEEAWPALLDQRLAQGGFGARVVNASISGETTAGGLSRLPALLETHRPSVVVIQLGANDGLRGLAIAQLQDNLRALVVASRGRGAQVVVIPMRVPPNYGPAYSRAFEATFAELPDAAHGVLLTPFFLKDVVLDPALMQADGLHPVAAAQPRMLDAVWPTIEAALKLSSQGAP